MAVHKDCYAPIGLIQQGGPRRRETARVTPGPIGFDIRTFECLACEHVHQTVVELLGDPMKHITTNTWLRGQLRAPT
jgi:hypothetical protein